VSPWDVLGVVLTELQAGKDGGWGHTGCRRDIGKLALDQVAGVVGDLEGGIQQPARDGDKGDGAARCVLPLRRAEELVVRVGLLEHPAVQAAQHRDEVLHLGGAQDLVKQQVIGVEKRIARHEDRDIAIARLLVEHEELLLGARTHDKAVGSKALHL